MSANNFILIKELNDGEYYVSEQDAETGTVVGELGRFRHSRDALQVAYEFQQENDVEYGIEFMPFLKETPPSESTTNN